MTLAQAIRAGSLLHEQGTGRLAEEVTLDMEDGTCEKTFTCALGAAYEAFFHTLPLQADDEGCYAALAEAFPSLTQQVDYPGSAGCFKGATGVARPRLESAILTLNDEEGWTRERIADWVESLGY